MQLSKVLIFVIVTWILPSEEPANSNPPSISAAKDVILACPPLAVLMEAILVNFSFNHTSIIPHLVAVKIKSLLMAMRWMSNPVVNDPNTALLGSENIFPAVASTDEPPAYRMPS